MSKRGAIKTTKEQIIEYWSGRVHEWDLSIDFSEAGERCWRCAYKTKLERCHIVPHSLGGPDMPNNYVLLCKLCHAEGPNVEDSEFFWDWLKAHKASFYDTYWIIRGMQEYEFVYKKSFEKELEELGPLDLSQQDVNELVQKKLKQGSWHFGQLRMNPATIAGLLRLVLMELRD